VRVCLQRDLALRDSGMGEGLGGAVASLRGRRGRGKGRRSWRNCCNSGRAVALPLGCRPRSTPGPLPVSPGRGAAQGAGTGRPLSWLGCSGAARAKQDMAVTPTRLAVDRWEAQGFASPIVLVRVTTHYLPSQIGTSNLVGKTYPGTLGVPYPTSPPPMREKRPLIGRDSMQQMSYNCLPRLMNWRKYRHCTFESQCNPLKTKVRGLKLRLAARTRNPLFHGSL